MSQLHDLAGQRARRALWFQEVRGHAAEMFAPDGTARIPQFRSPQREPLWIAPAFYEGPTEAVALINRVVGSHHDLPRAMDGEGRPRRHSSDFDIFRTNTLVHLCHRFADRLTPDARRVMDVHVANAARTFDGSGQPDTKFHGANDNMPMMATAGMVFAGEILGDEAVLRQGWWNLNQFRLLLSRGAWSSEYNSSTYTSVTLAAVAQIGSFARHPEIRALAREVEARLWAEALLHFHPGTFLQAGPQARAYPVDAAGHTHSLQFLFWAVFGPEASGRDPIRSLFRPDGREVIHFEGCPLQNVAEYTHFLDPEFHVPAELAELATKRAYPARLRGRSEGMASYEGRCVSYHTTTYMEEEFSLGSVDVPMIASSQTESLYVTYRRESKPADFRGGAPVFLRYAMGSRRYGEMNRSACGTCEGERFVPNEGWCYTLQKDNVGLLSVTPVVARGPVEVDALRLDVVFPAHYGRIRRSIVGAGPVRDGAVGESVEVVPVSVEAGEVYIHIWPLLPTNLPRTAALRFVADGDRYEVLQLVNYEGPRRSFSRAALKRCLNGVVLTVEAKRKYASLEEFHRAKSDARVSDLFFQDQRFVEFMRGDAWFQLVYSPGNPSAQTEAIDGRNAPRPVFESDQLDVSRLPFASGSVEPNFPMFRWKDSLNVLNYPNNSWIIGARGLPEERPYAHRVESIREP